MSILTAILTKPVRAQQFFRGSRVGGSRVVCWLLLALLFPLNSEAQNEKTWTLNFNDAELSELVRFVADATGLTIVLDPSVKGRVQVMSSEPLARPELYDLFLTILEVNGFTAMESAGIVRIVPLAAARAGGSAPAAGPRSSQEVVTQVIQVRNVLAAQLIPVLRPLAPQQAHMAAYGPSNSIILADTAANIRRIRTIIEQMDKAAVAETDIHRLRHASAEEILRMLEKLQGGAGREQGESRAPALVADKRTNSILITGDDMQRARLRALLRHLDAPQTQVGNNRVIYLRYANAAKMADVLNRVVQNASQAQGDSKTGTGGRPTDTSIVADEQTNSLIITADAEAMASLNAVIDRLDIRRAQVLVEAIIVEIRGGKGRDLGVEWLFHNDSGAYGSSSLNNGVLDATSAAQAGRGRDGELIDPRVGMRDALSNVAGQILGIGRLGSELSFNVVLSALQTASDANILSTPSLLTLDNEEAIITVGENVPFVTGSYTSTGNSGNLTNPFQTVQRENVGLTLRVTPHINEGDSLVLELEQEVSSLTNRAAMVNAADVITQERLIHTTVLADNGQTIVLGGLVQDSVTEMVQRVPVLGRMPLVGGLFRSTAVSKEKTHLMVFLRPMIMRDERSLSGATAEKYGVTRDAQLGGRAVGRGDGFLADDEFPVLPEWREQMRKLDALRSAEQAAVDVRPDGGQLVKPAREGLR